MMYRVLMPISNVPMVHCVLMLLCSFASYLITQAVSGSVSGARMRKTAVMMMKRAAWRRGSEGVSSLAAYLPFRTEVFSREHWKCIHWRCILEVHTLDVYWKCIHWMYTGSVYTGCILEVYALDVYIFLGGGILVPTGSAYTGCLLEVRGGARERERGGSGPFSASTALRNKFLRLFRQRKSITRLQ
jgi:hypothetical protein